MLKAKYAEALRRAHDAVEKTYPQSTDNDLGFSIAGLSVSVLHLDEVANAKARAQVAGDVLWYLAALAGECGLYRWDLWEAAEHCEEAEPPLVGTLGALLKVLPFAMRVARTGRQADDALTKALGRMLWALNNVVTADGGDLDAVVTALEARGAPPAIPYLHWEL